ncbi:MAG: DUF4839 domain-containing protein [Frankiales bacterium]|nr:DUF4839 domain-containing protein [Frankiales bacterium]
MRNRTPAVVVLLGCAIVTALTGCGGAASPAETVTSTVTVTPTVTPTPAPALPSDQPSRETSDPAASESGDSVADQVLTAKNSKALAAILKAPDYCDEKIAAFATTYAGRTIEFDGSIMAMDPHGDYKTRYDILIAPGDRGPNSTIGPAFKYENVNVFDLNLTGANIPDAVGVGDRLHLVAIVGEMNRDQCLFFLQPVSTEVR